MDSLHLANWRWRRGSGWQRRSFWQAISLHLAVLHEVAHMAELAAPVTVVSGTQASTADRSDATLAAQTSGLCCFTEASRLELHGLNKDQGQI
jgi:hypothetical protein